MKAQIRHCMVESSTKWDLDERVAQLVSLGWRPIDGATIAAPERETPHWVQFMYWAEEPILMEKIQSGPPPRGQLASLERIRA